MFTERDHKSVEKQNEPSFTKYNELVGSEKDLISKIVLGETIIAIRHPETGKILNGFRVVDGKYTDDGKDYMLEVEKENRTIKDEIASGERLVISLKQNLIYIESGERKE